MQHAGLYTLLLATLLVGCTASFAPIEDITVHHPNKTTGCVFHYENCTVADHCYDLATDQCVHKGLLPLSWRDIVTFVLALIICALASSCGIGGGTIFLPLLLLITNFSLDHASPIAAVMVFWSSIGGVVLNLFKRHPKADRPRIYFDVLFVMEPVILVGTVIGLLLFVILTDYIKYITLVLLFLLIGFRSFIRGRALYKKESAVVPISTLSKLNEALLSNEGIDDFPHEVSINENPELLKIQQKESRTPWFAIFNLFMVVGVDVVLSALRGQPDGNPSIVGIKMCSGAYWGIFTATVVFLLLCSFGFATYLRFDYARKLDIGYNFETGDIRWTKKNAYAIPMGTMLAGLMSGMLGVGGGFIISPLLQELGVLPQIATPTSLGTIIYTIIPVIAEYWMMGRFLLDYTIVFSFLAAVSGFAGQTIVTRLVDKYKKTYVIVFVLCFALFLSAVLISVFSIPPSFEKASLMKYESACAKSE